MAAADPRIDTVLAFNTGFFPTPTNGFGREQLANIKNKPVLVVNGGPLDVAYQNSIDNYNLLVAQGTPSYLASNSKRPGKAATRDQKAVIARARQAGGVAFVARSVEDVIAELNAPRNTRS